MSAAITETPDALFGTDDDRQQANRARAQERGLEPCTTCGRGVKPGSGWLVEVVDGGGQIAHPDHKADTSDPGYMGMWVLGPECGKHVPREFRVKWNGWDERHEAGEGR